MRGPIGGICRGGRGSRGGRGVTTRDATCVLAGSVRTDLLRFFLCMLWCLIIKASRIFLLGCLLSWFDLFGGLFSWPTGDFRSSGSTDGGSLIVCRGQV